LLPTSAPPYLNTIGQCLHFVIEGYGGENPDELAEFLDATRKYLTKNAAKDSSITLKDKAAPFEYHDDAGTECVQWGSVR
jgi:hypothetical protein